MQAYCSCNLEVEEIKEEAKKEWEAQKHEAVPDLALLIQANLHSGKSEQQLGKETLKLTQASLLEATGGILLSDDARQALILGVRSRVHIQFFFSIQFPGMFLMTKSYFFRRLYEIYNFQMSWKAEPSISGKRPCPVSLGSQRDSGYRIGKIFD